jgi:simple sugar transport system permease protein
MVLGVIRFDGTLSSWWTRIFIAALLLVFILARGVVTPKIRAWDGG